MAAAVGMAAVTAAVTAMSAADLAQVTVPALLPALAPDKVVHLQELSMEADHQGTRNGKPARQTLMPKIVQKAANRHGPDSPYTHAARGCPQLKEPAAFAAPGLS